MHSSRDAEIIYSPGAVGLDLDPTDKVFFIADSGSPGSPN